MTSCLLDRRSNQLELLRPTLGDVVYYYSFFLIVMINSNDEMCLTCAFNQIDFCGLNTIFVFTDMRPTDRNRSC